MYVAIMTMTAPTTNYASISYENCARWGARPTLMDTLKSKNQRLKTNDMSMLMLVAKFYVLLASVHNGMAVAGFSLTFAILSEYWITMATRTPPTA